MIWKQDCHNKVIIPEKIEGHVAKIRDRKKTISTLNGTFDLLHAGHLHIIFEASKQADVLIVAINSDSSCRAYKNKDPIVSLPFRLQMLTALEFVDYVTWFDELDPREILGKIKPDIHVNGSEYGQDCIEADIIKKNGGKMYFVDHIDDLSTSEIIKKINDSCA